ncbi:hypothetical protein PRIPAC_95625 [Pristionchus pacificus]|uniref:Acyltransferase n=1 Tax=Pristionchus pacificus TaxID=54126 RepID=A0A2A6BC77_PRIPA|nr:hypothetical protein PRIPAC_95625 [Pristionchus pacificus]|eukprot:PDM63441.1 Acyltransferase [Pristionchus pacificus]
MDHLLNSTRSPLVCCVNVTSSCHSSEMGSCGQTPFPEWIGWVPLVALCGWIFLVMWGSIFKEGRLGLLSIRKSWEELTSGLQSNLDVCDPLRIFGIFWVVINHSGSEGRVDILERLPSAAKFKASIRSNPLLGAFLGNSALGVECFLILSGLFSARSWMRHSQMDFWPHYVQYAFRRIARLYPSVIAFVAIAAGPLMKILLPRFEATMTSQCGAKGLLAHLSFVGNWLDMPVCLGYLWYISLDMQIHLIITPLIMHSLFKNRKVGIYLSIGAISLSTAMRGAMCVMYDTCNGSDADIPFISYPGVDLSMVKPIYAGIWELYARPQTKCGPFVIGLLFGVISLEWEEKKIWLTKRRARVLVAGGVALSVSMIYFILPEYWFPDMPSNIYNVTYTATFRSLFALGLVGIISGLALRKEVVFMHWTITVVSRLTFAAYLTHMPLVYILNSIKMYQDAETAGGLIWALRSS